ncbi:hypothetical protein ACFLQU_04770 [Verrucomicrobiota bacterium]
MKQDRLQSLIDRLDAAIPIVDHTANQRRASPFLPSLADQLRAIRAKCRKGDLTMTSDEKKGLFYTLGRMTESDTDNLSNREEVLNILRETAEQPVPDVRQ